MVYNGKSHYKMDDDWGYPYVRKPPYNNMWYGIIQSKLLVSNLDANKCEEQPTTAGPASEWDAACVPAQEQDQEEGVADPVIQWFNGYPLAILQVAMEKKKNAIFKR